MKKREIQRSSIVLWTIIAFMLVLVALSMVLRRAIEEEEAPPERPIPVHTMVVERRDVSDRVHLPGRIDPDLRAHLAVAKGGVIVEVLADKGDAVEEGQLLLRIDDRTWRAMLAQAEIELREAEKDERRWRELVETGAVSASDFDAVRTRAERARVQADDARTHVEQCEVRSPATGRINARLVEVGEYAPEGGAVFELVVNDPVRLTLDVPERDIGALALGDELAFRVLVLGDDERTGKITHISEAASPLNNSFRVQATVPNPDRRLRPGMIATAVIERARREGAVLAPLSAVIPRRGEHFVFVADEDRAVRRLVRIDRILGTEAVLASGLSEGDELIYEGHRELIDGAAIERMPQAERETAGI